MKNSKIVIALAGLTLILTVGCGQKKEDSPAPVNVVGVVGAVDVAAGPPRMPLTAYTEQVAVVSGTAQSPLNTGGRAFILGGTSFTASQLGTISAITIQGDIILDKNNGLVLPGNPNEIASSIYISVTDSVAGVIAGTLKAQSGRAANGTASMVFADNVGRVTINGTYNVVNGGVAQSTFQGTISFQNNNGTSGVLGTFSINTCSFFRCQ